MKFLAFFVTASLAAAPLKVEVSARTAIVMNADTGVILFEKEAHAPCYPASITKIATALYALEKKGSALEEAAIATHECIATIPSQVKHSAYDDHRPYRLESGGSPNGHHPSV